MHFSDTTRATWTKVNIKSTKSQLEERGIDAYDFIKTINRDKGICIFQVAARYVKIGESIYNVSGKYLAYRVQ